MRDFSAQQGVDNTDPDYLNGKIVDLATLVGEGVNQDLVQFFQKLADLAGIVFSGDPDNESNGYQLIQALELVVRTFAATTVLKGVVEKATTAEAQAGAADKFLDAALLQLVTATESRKGVQENATLAEAQALTSDSHTITPATLAGVTGGLRVVLLDIGDWNMDANPGIIVSHGVDASKIRRISGIIRDDGAVNIYNFPYSSVTANEIELSIEEISSTSIILSRRTGSQFDNAAFDSTGYNRGWLVIELIP